MDKLRREAERSGDSLRYALELRRQGQNRRAKRLLQDLAWDKHSGATDALEQLYPFSERLTKQIEGLQGSRRDCFYAASELIGSLDPRVNDHCRKAMIPWSSDESTQSETRDFFKKWIDYLEERDLPTRLFFAPRNLAKALKWAEPLPEELPEIVDQFRASQIKFGVPNLGPGIEMMLAWHLCKAQLAELIPAVIERFEAANWRDRQLVASVNRDRDLNGDLPAAPNWGLPELSPLELYDPLSGAYLRSVFVDSKNGDFGEAHQWTKANDWPSELILLNIDRMRDINDNLGCHQGDLAIQRFVGLWQDCVGDRVIRWSAGDYIVPWELGSMKETLKRLVIAVKDAHFLGSISHPSFTMGVTSFHGDWFEAVERARINHELALDRGLPYIPKDSWH